MCGIAGLFHADEAQMVSPELLTDMVAMLNHRGPDQSGMWTAGSVGLGSARLNIIDPVTGRQPIHNEDKTIWLVLNGEIYNYPELRRRLMSQGHRFYTRTDTEVLVHLYEEKGIEFLNHVNGQFALALWDGRRRRLLIARDRMGIRPLFYAHLDGCFAFASEIKALLLNPAIEARLNPRAVDQIFTFWVALPPETVFHGIYQLPPGTMMLVDRTGIQCRSYWQLSFPPEGEEEQLSEEAAIEQLRALLVDATRQRLRADVPVGVYLSGGIDSSVIASIIRFFTDHPLQTFSVRFANDFYDESFYQQLMINHLQAEHRAVACSDRDIGASFPRVIWHAEAPVLRTAPTPLYLLAQLVHQSGVKVVLSGEGGDEVFLGYDLFRETKIRHYWAQHPVTRRTLLFKRLYPYLTLSQVQSSTYLKAFFGAGLQALDAPHYSHIVTWSNTAKAKKFFSPELKSVLEEYDAIEAFLETLPEDFHRWHVLSRAQYIDMKLLLAGYLLASQGDRMAMAHAVEGRFPYLDHRVVEWAAAMPPTLKLRGMREKYVLKKAFADLVPASIRRRPKQAYRAPNTESFFTHGEPLDYVAELLSPRRIREVGYFDPELVGRLLKKCQTKGRVMGEVDNMAFVGILSLQLLHDHFIKNVSTVGRARASATLNGQLMTVG